MNVLDVVREILLGMLPDENVLLVTPEAKTEIEICLLNNHLLCGGATESRVYDIPMVLDDSVIWAETGRRELRISSNLF